MLLVIQYKVNVKDQKIRLKTNFPKYKNDIHIYFSLENSFSKIKYALSIKFCNLLDVYAR